jgi:leader peptidase (prepilin peptidase)/N-methyltransferase
MVEKIMQNFLLVPGLLPAVFFLFGTCIGSFLNVCIFRLPNEKSIIFPASHCLQCGTELKPVDNIPIISFLLLGGKCRSCHTRISWQYPLVELLTGILFALTALRFGWQWDTAVALILISASIVVSVIDLRIQIIPNVISLPGIVIGLLINLLPSSPLGFLNAVYGMLLGGGLFYLVALVSRGGMGGGDVKLIAMFGAFLGWKKCLLTIFLGVLLGALVGVVLMLLKRKGRKDPIPFGPFLCIGALISVFYGREIIFWYLHMSTFLAMVPTLKF